MAIIKIGAPLTGIRGTIGGITYSANKSGPYAKAWARSSNPRTEKQTTERSYLAELSTKWRDIGWLYRAAWDSFAALPAQELTNSLGEAYYASGWNWFCKCNIRLLRLSRTPESLSPSQARPAAPAINDFRVCAAGTESDLCEGGAASSSSEAPGYPPAQAFDNLLAYSKSWLTLSGQTTGWLEYDFAAPLNIKRYRIYLNVTVDDRAPRDWTFEVFSAGQWQVIHAVTDAELAFDEWNDFYCPNAYTETNYRINITENEGDVGYIGITELEMYAGDEGSSVICYPEDEFDDSPSYDLVLHISLGQTIGKAVQYPGYYETLVTQTPGRWYALFQDELEAVFGTITMNRSWFGRLYRQTQEGVRSAAAAKRTVTIGG